MFSVHPRHCQRRATSCKTGKDNKLAALDEPKLKPLKKVVKPAKSKKHLEHGMGILEDPRDFSSTSSESFIMDDPIALVEAEPETDKGAGAVAPVPPNAKEDGADVAAPVVPEVLEEGGAAVAPKWHKTVDAYPRLKHTLPDGEFGRHEIRLVQNEELGWYDITAYCSYHRGCKKSRTVREGRRLAQGRPLGYLWAWLQQAPNFTCPMAQKDHFSDKVSQQLEVRQAARREATTVPGVEAWLRAERPCRDGEPDEPVGCP